MVKESKILVYNTIKWLSRFVQIKSYGLQFPMVFTWNEENATDCLVSFSRTIQKTISQTIIWCTHLILRILVFINSFFPYIFIRTNGFFLSSDQMQNDNNNNSIIEMDWYYAQKVNVSVLLTKMRGHRSVVYLATLCYRFMFRIGIAYFSAVFCFLSVLATWTQLSIKSNDYKWRHDEILTIGLFAHAVAWNCSSCRWRC